ncbi:integration host factor subunit beta [Methylomonas sp. AM2-LC]|uniref:integration host factor subunit beta n=1 Tax=Methylomonas sp. AM2-LC TaxID=3153301 RepID=UPI003263D7D3
MKKSKFIEVLANKRPNLQVKQVQRAVNSIVEQLTHTLANGERIEIRGFGSFSVKRRDAHTGRNPKTGQAVVIQKKRIIHFKPGQELRFLVNAARKKYKIND